VYPKLIEELFPAARHHCERYGNNKIEADHGSLNAGYDRCDIYATTVQPP